MRRIHVIAAVIRDEQNRILIAKRPDHVHQGGLWEFPGGKLEADETRLEGLTRELHEELGIQVTEARPLLDIRHDYPDKSVRLDVWLVTRFEGQAHGAEGQPVCWVAPAELDEYSFPAANAPIIRAAQLPEQYLITPDLSDEQALFSGLQQAHEAGIQLVQLRQTGLTADDYQALAARVVSEFGDTFQLLVKGDTAPEWPGVGWHLTRQQLQSCWEQSRSMQEATSHPEVWGKRLIAASCHNADELQMAAQLGVDFVTLSPVQPTSTHPDAQPLGWEVTGELIDSINIPVYLLGGMRAEDLPQAFAAGAQGIAAIRALWPQTHSA